MARGLFARNTLLFCLLFAASPSANAWFILPIGLIARALEKDPDKIEVSYKDRQAGQCAGLHVNQASKQTLSDEEKTFHSSTADKILEGAEDKGKTKDLSEAYSLKWGRAGQIDLETGRTYGKNLASSCRSIGMPITLAHQRDMQQQEENKRQQEAKRQEEEKIQQEVKRQLEIKQQDEAKRLQAVRLKEETDARTKAEMEAKANAEAEAVAAAERLRIVETQAAKMPQKSLEVKLKELKQLHAKGLISKEVYDSRQKELLSQH